MSQSKVTYFDEKERSHRIKENQQHQNIQCAKDMPNVDVQQKVDQELQQFLIYFEVENVKHPVIVVC